MRTASPELPVELAFLESMAPDLPSAIRAVADAGATRICIVPLFFGQGGHLRIDVPAIVADIERRCRASPWRWRELRATTTDVVAALVAFCLGEARKG